MLVPSGANLLVYKHRKTEANPVPGPPKQDFLATRSVYFPSNGKISFRFLNSPQSDSVLKTWLFVFKFERKLLVLGKRVEISLH